MFSWVTQGWEELLSFFETGGDVLIAIFIVTVVMWAIIVERFSYLKVGPHCIHLGSLDLSRWCQRRTRTGRRR